MSSHRLPDLILFSPLFWLHVPYTVVQITIFSISPVHILVKLSDAVGDLHTLNRDVLGQLPKAVDKLKLPTEFGADEGLDDGDQGLDVPGWVYDV